MDKEKQVPSSQPPQEASTSLQLSILTKARVKPMTPTLYHPKNSESSHGQKLYQADLARAAQVKEELLTQLTSRSSFKSFVSVLIEKETADG